MANSNSVIILSSLFLTTLLYLSQVSAVLKGENNPNSQCAIPPIDFAAQDIDVLGDREKGSICKLPRPWSLCENVGPADDTCKKIARAVGGTERASCSHKNICKFWVRRPVQRPNEPGFAYVSLCEPETVGVIFPCSKNNLRIVNPDFRA